MHAGEITCYACVQLKMKFYNEKNKTEKKKKKKIANIIF